MDISTPGSVSPWKPSGQSRGSRGCDRTLRFVIYAYFKALSLGRGNRDEQDGPATSHVSVLLFILVAN